MPAAGCGGLPAQVPVLSREPLYPKPPWVNYLQPIRGSLSFWWGGDLQSLSAKVSFGHLEVAVKTLLWWFFWMFLVCLYLCLLLSTLLGITCFASCTVVLRVFVSCFVWRGEMWCNLISVVQVLLSWGKEGSIAMRFLFMVWSPYVIVVGLNSFLWFYLSLTNHIFLVLSSSCAFFFLSVSLTFISSNKTPAMLLQLWTSAVVHCHLSSWETLLVSQQSSTVKN